MAIKIESGVFKAIEEDVIDKQVIENCEINDACDAGLTWLREKPRTYADLHRLHRGWYVWLAENSTLIPVLVKLAEDRDSDVRREAKKRLAALQGVAQ